MKTHSIYTGVSIFTKNIILSPNIFNLMHLHNSHYISIFYAAYKTTKTSTGTILKNGPAKTPPRSTDERTYLVFNTKRPLSDVWLLRYKQNSFGCFQNKSEALFLSKTPKTVLLISQQPNIAQRPFCIQNERQDTLYHLI